MTFSSDKQVWFNFCLLRTLQFALRVLCKELAFLKMYAFFLIIKLVHLDILAHILTKFGLYCILPFLVNTISLVFCHVIT